MHLHELRGLTNVTFRGNRFSNCQTNAIAFGNGGDPANVAGKWLIENNWFGACPGGTAGGNGPYCVNFTNTRYAAYHHPVQLVRTW